jgi:hypothetical protein
MLKGLLTAFAVVILAFVAYVAFAIYQNDSAKAAAQAFCDGAATGSDISIPVAKANAAGIKNGLMTNDGMHVFIFRGSIFNATLCELRVADGKVTSKAVAEQPD